VNNKKFKELGKYLKKDTYTVVKVYKDMNSDSYRYIEKNDDLIIWLSPERLQENFISIDDLLKEG
jgi:hypothetical protein